MKEIATALVKAQKSFGPALKNRENGHLKQKYADLSACLDAVIDAFNANGIMLMQQTHECQDGVIVETVFLHESGEQMSAGKLHVPATKKDAQGYGSAMSYARRYSLMAACGISAEDDDGSKASHGEKKKPTLDHKRLKDAIERIKEGKYTTDKLRETFDLTDEQDKFVVEALSNE